MKRILTIVLVCIMVFSMAACGNQGNENGGTISVISREDGSGTRGAFVELMGIMVEDVDQTTVNAEISQSTSVVMTTIAGNKQAIGYVSLGSLDESVKAIKVDGIEASSDTIKAGDYAVSRPFLVTTGKAVSPLTEDFVEYILSAEGQSIVEEEGYITVSEAAANYEVKSGLSGKIVVAGSTSVAPVMQILADSYKAMYEDVTIEIQQTGSGAGITSTIEGACDLGMSSRELKAEEEAQGITGTNIALDGIAVVVNLENPVEDLTSEQIRQIFTGEVTGWAEVQ